MKAIFFLSFIFLVFTACSQKHSEEDKKNPASAMTKENDSLGSYVLSDFLSSNEPLDQDVNSVFSKLDAHQKIAQLIMPAIGEHGQTEETINSLVKEGKIGGLLLLNGTKSQFSGWVMKYNNLNDSLDYLPFLYSADAEPSLVNRKIKNTTPVANANKLNSKEEVTEVANTISSELNEIGINYNFAPVVDMSPNKTVGWRSFGHSPENVIPWSNAFIKETQQSQIIATAKHFPGHGFVEGDTHKKLVYIDGEMKEVKNYPPLIKNGVLSIMIAHIAVKNNEQYNTQDMPSTTSRKIVTDLLRDSLNFQGLIITDAMNMGGVRDIVDAEILALQAGCDIVLMPLKADETHTKILKRYNSDADFAKQVDESVKRIIRAKLCLGLFVDNKL